MKEAISSDTGDSGGPIDVAIKCIRQCKISRASVLSGSKQKWNAQAEAEMENLGIVKARQERKVKGSEYLVRYFKFVARQLQVFLAQSRPNSRGVYR